MIGVGDGGVGTHGSTVAEENKWDKSSVVLSLVGEGR